MGGSQLIKADDARKRYLMAIRQADKGEIQPLMKFARA
jgi:hypothetical protein